MKDDAPQRAVAAARASACGYNVRPTENQFCHVMLCSLAGLGGFTSCHPPAICVAASLVQSRQDSISIKVLGCVLRGQWTAVLDRDRSVT